jgi:hypothetical protein
MYILLCGFPPFYAEDDDDLFDLTIEGDYSYPSPFWDGVSSEAKDLIDRMLATDPKKRYSCDQILKHPWLTEKNNTAPMPMAQEQLKQWRARRRWKKGLNAIVAAKKFNFGKSLLEAAKASEAAGGGGRSRGGARRGGGTGSAERTDCATDQAEEEGDSTREAVGEHYSHGERRGQGRRLRGVGGQVGGIECRWRSGRSRSSRIAVVEGQTAGQEVKQ